MILKAEYEITRKFWPRTKRNWMIFFRNPWRYWRSYVLKKQIEKRFADQIRVEMDRLVLEEMMK